MPGYWIWRGKSCVVWFEQKTGYELLVRGGGSDVCASDVTRRDRAEYGAGLREWVSLGVTLGVTRLDRAEDGAEETGRASRGVRV